MTAFPAFPSDGQIYIVGSRSWTYNEAQDGWILNRGGPTGPQGIQGPTGPMGVLLTSLTVDTFAGDGITTQFTLSIIPQSVYNMIVDIDGLVQTAVTNYSVVSNNIIFSTAPILGSSITVVHFITGSAIPGPTGAPGLIGPTGARTGFTGPTGPAASTADTITIRTTGTDSNFYPVWVSNISGSLPLYAGSDLLYNPFTSTLSINGNISVTNSTRVGNLSITNTIPTTNASTGSLTVAGGAGIDGNLFVENNITANGTYGIIAPNRPAFRVTGLTSNNWTSGTTLSGSNVVIDYNQGNFYDNTTGIFTAPTSGLYHVFLQCRVGDTNGLSQVAVYKNDSIVQAWWEIVTNNQSAQHFGVSTISKLATGDTLQAKVVTGSIQFDSNDNWGAAYIG